MTFWNIREWTCFLQEKREREKLRFCDHPKGWLWLLPREWRQLTRVGWRSTLSSSCRSGHTYREVRIRWSEVKNCNTRTSSIGKRSILSRRLIYWWLTRSVWCGQIYWMRWMICCVVIVPRTSLSVGCSCCWSVICSSWLPWWKRTSGRCWNSITHRRSFSIVRLWQPPVTWQSSWNTFIGNRIGNSWTCWTGYGRTGWMPLCWGCWTGGMYRASSLRMMRGISRWQHIITKHKGLTTWKWQNYPLGLIRSRQKWRIISPLILIPRRRRWCWNKGRRWCSWKMIHHRKSVTTTGKSVKSRLLMTVPSRW